MLLFVRNQETKLRNKTSHDDKIKDQALYYIWYAGGKYLEEEKAKCLGWEQLHDSHTTSHPLPWLLYKKPSWCSFQSRNLFNRYSYSSSWMRVKELGLENQGNNIKPLYSVRKFDSLSSHGPSLPAMNETPDTNFLLRLIIIKTWTNQTHIHNSSQEKVMRNASTHSLYLFSPGLKADKKLRQEKFPRSVRQEITHIPSSFLYSSLECSPFIHIHVHVPVKYRCLLHTDMYFISISFKKTWGNSLILSLPLNREDLTVLSDGSLPTDFFSPSLTWIPFLEKKDALSTHKSNKGIN